MIVFGKGEMQALLLPKAGLGIDSPASQVRNRLIRVALAGNPNSGKSSVFNSLTGARQHVGNWPGKTVERKLGRFVVDEFEVELVDLPGIYSLSAFSLEEMIARDYIVNERPDVVICVVDATNLERNLYLTVQLLELGVPVIVALNMSDQAAMRGLRIDTALLSQELGAPVVATIGSRGVGMDELRAELVKIADLEIARFASSHSASSQPDTVHSCL
jgi:ferrous iron transport protein B